MGLTSSWRWTCPGCRAENEQPQPLDLEVSLPLKRNGVMQGSQVVRAITVVPVTCSACGLVSLYDADVIRDG